MTLLLLTESARESVWLVDSAGRLVALVADNKIVEPAPEKCCACCRGPK